MPLPLFSKTLSLQGYDIEQAKLEYALLSQSTVQEIEDRKAAIVAHHITHNPFYSSITQSNEWDSLPILTKRDLQQPLEKRITPGYKKLFKGKTSGSSGHPFYFAKDKYAHAITWAAFFNAYNEHDINLDKDYQARFYGIPLSGKSRYIELLKDYVSQRKRFPIFNLNEEVLEYFIDRFKKSPFQYINGYTSSILLLAQYCINNNQVLKNLCPTLKACIVTSEMLFPDDRITLEKGLGIPIINEYGASEVGLIAMENSNNLFVLNNNNLFIEVVDDNNKSVLPGQTGRILITDLYNKAHPMIRYEIGDIGSIETHSSGKLILKQLQGRTSDVARLPSGKVVPGLTFYYVTKSIINTDSDILEFIVIQTTPSEFEIHYVSKNELSDSLKSNIQRAMDEYLEPGLSVIFTKKEFLDRSTRGKLKQFISNVQGI
ncbi:MAG: phenylacetate--CoA ligase family protein [Bacteroidota bacterium]|nr:phenylacetate--CoA ligase family protein [Bacteroidota bacterium]